LIDFQGNFNPAMSHLRIGDHKSVSIVGLQSSGKSTLLNDLYGTSFAVLAQGRCEQTTKGVNAHISESLLLFDVEGTDSQERDAEKNVAAVECRYALFALAASDVMCFNVNVGYIGRQNGLYLDLLKTIIEDISQIVVKKYRIIYVVRDFDEEEFSEDVIKQQILNNVKHVWSSAIKPPVLSSGLDDVFDIDIITLPHRGYRRREYQAKVEQLRSAVEKKLEASLYVSTGTYLDLWEKIKSNTAIYFMSEDEQGQQLSTAQAKRLQLDTEIQEAKAKKSEMEASSEAMVSQAREYEAKLQELKRKQPKPTPAPRTEKIVAKLLERKSEQTIQPQRSEAQDESAIAKYKQLVESLRETIATKEAEYLQLNHEKHDLEFEIGELRYEIRTLKREREEAKVKEEERKVQTQEDGKLKEYDAKALA